VEVWIENKLHIHTDKTFRYIDSNSNEETIRGSLIGLIAPLASLIARSCDRFFLQALMDLLGA
jgi:hypothetical protein